MKIAKTPEELIPEGKEGWITSNGIFYRKGTTTATYENVNDYQRVITEGINEKNRPILEKAVNDQRFITNMLRYGLYFSQFPPIDWFKDEKNEGRMMPALLLLQQFPDLMTDEVKVKLEVLCNQVSVVTKELIKETLNYFYNYLKKKEATEAVLKSIFLDYIKALENKDSHEIEKYWSEEGVFIVPAQDTWLKGKKEILNFTKNNFNNFVSLKFVVHTILFQIDLLKGNGRLLVNKKMQINLIEHSDYDKRPLPQQAIVMVDFKRKETPSCMPIIHGYGDWTIGEWQIVSWMETFPLSALS